MSTKNNKRKFCITTLAAATLSVALVIAFMFGMLGAPYRVFAESESVSIPTAPTYTVQQFKDYTDEMFYISSSFTSSENCTLPYRAHKPFNTSGSMPLVVYLHGRGERGTDNEKQFTYWPYLSEDSKFYDAYVLAPQCPVKQFDNGWVDYFTYEGQKAAEGYSSNTFKVDNIPESKECKAVIELIVDVCKHNNIDRNRIYITGFSQGAVATWYLIAKHPDLFAAAVPISGIGDLTKAEVYADMPIFAFHGEEDETVNYATGTKALYDAINAVGKNKMHFASFIGGDHAFSGQQSMLFKGSEKLPGLEAWLFAQSKQAAPQKTETKKKGCRSELTDGAVLIITGTLALLAIGLILTTVLRKKDNA